MCPSILNPKSECFSHFAVGFIGVTDPNNKQRKNYVVCCAWRHLKCLPPHDRVAFIDKTPDDFNRNKLCRRTYIFVYNITCKVLVLWLFYIRRWYTYISSKLLDFQAFSLFPYKYIWLPKKYNFKWDGIGWNGMWAIKFLRSVWCMCVCRFHSFHTRGKSNSNEKSFKILSQFKIFF